MSSPDAPEPDPALDETARRIQQLEAALESHAVVDQARGILMALHRIDADGAWALLVRVSSHQNVKIRTLAEAVIAIITSREPVEASPATDAALHYLLPRAHGPSDPAGG